MVNFFFASIDTISGNEAFVDGHSSLNPDATLTVALMIVFMLLILSGKKTILFEFPRNWKQLKEYLKTVWKDEPNSPP